MTNTPGRTAESVAAGIIECLSGHCVCTNHPSNYVLMTDRIMEYAKQEVAKAQAVSRQLHDNREDVWKSHIDLVVSESRKKALTEAAGMARKRSGIKMFLSDYEQGIQDAANEISEEIEALRGKDG